MNAAARALAQGSFTTSSVRPFVLSNQSLGLILLIVAVLASALAVVYVKALDRNLFSDLQTLQQTRDDLRVAAGQLLLEQNTWAAPARVQAIAQQQLGMVVPGAKDVATITIARTAAETTVDG
jgi:cell division protein FtsL